MNRIFVVPAIVQAAAIAVMLWQPMPFGLYAQFVSVAVMAVVFGVGGSPFCLFPSALSIYLVLFP